MPKFRKKPIVIEAVLASEIIKNAKNSDCPSQPEWIRKLVDEEMIVFSNDVLFIETLEGTMRAEPTDYIIYGVNGEVYPCKPDIFEKTYESAE